MAADIFKCVICNSSDCEENLTKLTKKGCDSLKSSGEARGENLKFNNCGESFVHGDCRKNYVSKHKIAQFKRQQQSATTTTDCDSDRSRKTSNQHCIFCGFKLVCGCSGNCDTRRCSCRKNGMECTVACKNCKGVSCQNVMNEDIENKNAFE